MADIIEAKRKLRAIRRLSASFPHRTALERLDMIVNIASGKAEPRVPRRPMSETLGERLAAGQASRAKRTAPKVEDQQDRKKKFADPEGEAELKRRRAKASRNRQEYGGQVRSE